MREQFEKLPEIAEKLHTVVFSESHNTYHAKLINSPLSVMFVQGAWYAYQEQQKKIDAVKELSEHWHKSSGSALALNVLELLK